MKRTFILTIMLALCATGLYSQLGQQGQQQRFSPERFDAELQQFITDEAHLTAEEATRFFPVFKEMKQKQRQLFNRQREQSRVKPQDEAGCMNAIKERDEIELQLKHVQQTYHNKFLEILPASKVYDIINAEDRFHRRMMRNWGQHRQGQFGGHSQRFGGGQQQRFGQPQRFGGGQPPLRPLHQN